MIAAVTLKFLDPFGTGKLVLFQVTYDKVIFIPSLACRGLEIMTGLACIRIATIPPIGCLWCKLQSRTQSTPSQLFARVYTVHTSPS